MAEETKQSTNSKSTGFQQEFNALPLEEKFSQLLQMEMATLNEAAKYVADSTMKVIEKVGDALSDLGTKVETEARKAAGANECVADEEPKAKAKPGAKKKPAGSKPSENN